MKRSGFRYIHVTSKIDPVGTLKKIGKQKLIDFTVLKNPLSVAPTQLHISDFNIKPSNLQVYKLYTVYVYIHNYIYVNIYIIYVCVSYLHTLSILSLITGYPDISILMRQRGSNPFEFGLPGYLSPGLPHLLVEEQCHIGFCRHLLPQRCDSARENEGPGTLRNKKWFLCGSCLMIYMIDMIYSRYQRF
jgi:hypothetical protein